MVKPETNFVLHVGINFRGSILDVDKPYAHVSLFICLLKATLHESSSELFPSFKKTHPYMPLLRYSTRIMNNNERFEPKFV